MLTGIGGRSRGVRLNEQDAVRTPIHAVGIKSAANRHGGATGHGDSFERLIATRVKGDRLAIRREHRFRKVEITFRAANYFRFEPRHGPEDTVPEAAAYTIWLPSGETAIVLRFVKKRLPFGQGERQSGHARDGEGLRIHTADPPSAPAPAAARTSGIAVAIKARRDKGRGGGKAATPPGSSSMIRASPMSRSRRLTSRSRHLARSVRIDAGVDKGIAVQSTSLAQD